MHLTWACFQVRMLLLLMWRPSYQRSMGVVRTKANQGMILGTIRSIVSGFTLGDPITMAKNIEELCDVEITDTLAWVSAMKQLADEEEDVGGLKKGNLQGLKPWQERR